MPREPWAALTVSEESCDNPGYTPLNSAPGGVHVPALIFDLPRFEGFTYGTCTAGADRVF
jgi:hypothetical protein